MSAILSSTVLSTIRRPLGRLRRRLRASPPPVGGQSPSRPLVVRRALTDAEQATVDAFHKIYYEPSDGRQNTLNLVWLGVRATKCPFDLWTYQEIVVETRPDLIIESGTRFGGTSLFLASIFDQLGGRGRVLTLDIDPAPKRPKHRRIEYMIGSSVDPETIAKVHRLAARHRAMVILDSDHSETHVLAELNAYQDLVAVGCYLIVEDSNVNGRPVRPDFGPGPGEAVDSFLATTDDFVVDRDRERFLVSLNPGGYLRRVK